MTHDFVTLFQYTIVSVILYSELYVINKAKTFFHHMNGMFITILLNLWKIASNFFSADKPVLFIFPMCYLIITLLTVI